MKPVVLIHIKGGVPTIIGGAEGLQVYFLDFDSFDPHPSYYSQVVDLPMNEVAIVNYINSELDEQNTIN